MILTQAGIAQFFGPAKQALLPRLVGSGHLVAAEAGGIRFRSYADFPQDDNSLGRFRDLLAELLPDAPDQAGVPAPTVAWVRSSYLEQPSWDPAGVLLAVDSTQGARWVAMAHVTLQGDHGYFNTFTGVRRPYRGRGLAQAMKLQAIGYARGKGGIVIFTRNDSSNAPMLSNYGRKRVLRHF